MSRAERGRNTEIGQHGMGALRTQLAFASVIMATILAPTPVARAAETWLAPASIDPTGASDVTQQLQSFMSEVPDGTTLSFPPNARYRIEGTLVIEGRKDLTIDGAGALFFATTEGDRSRRHWSIRNSDGITVRDVVVRGANPNAGRSDAAYRADREAQHGFDISGSRTVVLERVTVTDVFGDFVYIGGGKGGWSRNVTVRDSQFERNGRQGIAITGGEDVRIEHNRISEVRRSTFDIEPNSSNWGARRVTIIDNDIGPGRLNFLAGRGGAAPVEDIAVIGNRLSGKALTVDVKAPSSMRRSNFSLVANVSDVSFGSPSSPIRVSGFDGVVIRENVQPLDARRRMTGVRLASTCNAVIEGNQFANAVQVATSDGYQCGEAQAPAPTPTAAPTPGEPTPTEGAPPGQAPTTSGRDRSGPPAAAPVPPSAGDQPPPRTPAAEAPPASRGASPADGTAAPEASATQPDSGNATIAYENETPDENSVWMPIVASLVSATVLIALARRERRHARRSH